MFDGNLPLILLGMALLAMMAAIARADASGPWQANPEVVQSAAERHPGVTYREADVPDYTLPDVLRITDGQIIETVEAWRRHREQLLEQFRTEMYGRRPGPPDELTFEVIERIDDAVDGEARFARIAVHSRHQGREHRFEFGLFLPPDVPGPVPAVLLIDFGSDRADFGGLGYRPPRAALGRGVAGAVFHYGDVAPDDADRFTEGVIRLMEGELDERPADAWMAIAAWGWGASRVMDYLEQDERIDHGRVALVGVSRNGKAALWGAAEDERFDIAVSMLSGCGGAALSRRRFGESIEIINRLFPHWFAERFRHYSENEAELPIDQHQLVALLAPRGVYITSADEDLWADPRGEYLSLAHGSKAYTLWGYDPLDPDAMPGLREPLIAGPMGYHIREEGHRVLGYDWQRIMDFVMQRWEDERD
jgi:hypothetical protein